MKPAPYLPRLADDQLTVLFAELPAIMLVGPRAAGKTTSARRLAAATLSLDVPAVAEAVRADPDAALRRSAKPLLLDEWQEVPEVLGAVKRAVDAAPATGQFLLTGSVEAPPTGGPWPGTGRVVPIVMHGLTQREIAGAGPGLEALSTLRSLDDVVLPAQVPDVDGYVGLAMAGGFPEPVLRLRTVARQAWLDAYLAHLVDRDVRAAGEERDPVRLRRYLQALALSTGGTPDDLTLNQAADVDRRTGAAYDRLLQRLYVLDNVPAWTSNRLARLLKRSKRYLADAGVAAAAARVGSEDVLTDGDLLGRMLDTFVAAQIRPEVALTTRAQLHHVRTEAGRQEIDLLVDLGGGRVIGIEVKAGAAPGLRDVRHLAWLRDKLGDGFVRGIVFHTGPHPYELGDRLWALPICALWGGPAVRPDRADVVAG